MVRRGGLFHELSDLLRVVVWDRNGNALLHDRGVVSCSGSNNDEMTFDDRKVNFQIRIEVQWGLRGLRVKRSSGIDYRSP